MSKPVERERLRFVNEIIEFVQNAPDDYAKCAQYVSLKWLDADNSLFEDASLYEIINVLRAMDAGEKGRNLTFPKIKRLPC